MRREYYSDTISNFLSTTPDDVFKVLAKNTDFNRPNLRMNRNLVHQAFQIAKNYRLTDENLYLRVFYIDFMYNRILTSFSCGGTRYQKTEKFIDDYYKMNEPV